MGVPDDSWLSQTLLPSHQQVLLTLIHAHACIFLLECSEKYPGGWVFHVALSLPCQGFLSPARWCCLDSPALYLIYARGLSQHISWNLPETLGSLSKGLVFITALPTKSHCILFVHCSDYSVFASGSMKTSFLLTCKRFVCLFCCCLFLDLNPFF